MEPNAKAIIIMGIQTKKKGVCVCVCYDVIPKVFLGDKQWLLREEGLNGEKLKM